MATAQEYGVLAGTICVLAVIAADLITGKPMVMWSAPKPQDLSRNSNTEVTDPTLSCALPDGSTILITRAGPKGDQVTAYVKKNECQ